MDTSNALISRQASLVLLGQWFHQQHIWPEIVQAVHVPQKVLRYTPQEKMLDAFITILAGGQSVAASNLRVRPDRAVQLAFGRTGCAEQSTISDTLSACQVANVTELRQALNRILQQHGQSPGHDYAQRWQLLDVDLTGLGGGLHGEGVTRGYFAEAGRRRGRQLGRVLASLYAESVVEHVYAGKRQLEASFQELVVDAETALNLDESRRARTLLRVDGGGGSAPNITWALERHYGVLMKLHSAPRAKKLAQSVTTWYPDPKIADRSLGWVTTPTEYGYPTRQYALRYPKKDKQGQLTWHYQVVVCSVSDEVLHEVSHGAVPSPCPAATSLALLSQVYDLRSGGLETQNRGDKQGLGLAKRTKQSFVAQEILVLLTQLAHNVVIWARNRLAATDPHFQKFGIQRMVRDVLQIEGQVFLMNGQIHRVLLSPQHPFATAVHQAFTPSAELFVA